MKPTNIHLQTNTRSPNQGREQSPSELFSAQEITCLKKYAQSPYETKYLLIRLCLRKSNKWHRFSSLRYTSELSEDEIRGAIEELCASPLPVPQPMAHEEVGVKKEEDDRDIIDLTFSSQEEPEDEEEEEGCLNAQPTPNVDSLDDTDDPDLSMFAEDEDAASLEELLDCLSLEELKVMGKQLKLKKVPLRRAQLIATMLESSSTQSTLPFALTTSSSPSHPPSHTHRPRLQQSTLSFSAKGGNGRGQLKLKTQKDRLREMVLNTLDKCIRIRAPILDLFHRINIIYFRSTQHTTSLLLPSLLSFAKKRSYCERTYTRTPDIWNSRMEVLDYQRALKLEAEVDLLFGTAVVGDGVGGRGRGSGSGTPGLSAVASRMSVGSQIPSTQAMPIPTQGMMMTQVGVGGEEQEEKQRVKNARAVKLLFEKVYDWWKRLVQTKGEVDARPRGLERFDCGHVLTRIVCKGSYALGIMKEYEYELNVLESLLAQKRWRRGRRGRWHDRRALILMTHLDNEDDEIAKKAFDAIVEGLEDVDTHLIFRPMLERRLTRIEKRLGIPVDERHVCEGKLRKAIEVFVEGTRVKHRAASLIMDETARVVNTPAREVKGLAHGPVKVEQKPKSLFAFGTPVGTAGESSVSAEKRRVGIRERSSTGKSIWIGRDGDEVSVEILALQYYESLGFRGFHSEGSIVRTIFGLLFWDIIFADVPGAFETPYQTAPLDIAEDSFYLARQDLIERRLADIKAGEARQILEAADDKYRATQTWCVGVRWDLFEKQDLAEIVECLGGRSLEVICRLMCEDYSGRSGGVPDLLVWNVHSQECKFVEVKGPGDTLQENQKIWINELLRSGTSVEVCHIAEEGQSKKPKAKTTKSGKPKKSAEIVDSDSDDELAPESEDEDGLPPDLSQRRPSRIPKREAVDQETDVTLSKPRRPKRAASAVELPPITKKRRPSSPVV
ncbi:hypothetical protein JAAARDRAFT_571662 [Jaapia argillacea MUCL 33604]|uniref:Fanconi-associated nuclease n=1 Tax=Jaapia argillacea MUCL 33604 TaxID=933084 RepID=A0A067Q1X8_9AGAM|nr:hypothetical protein JAAARDRAFT_571662 [Jaapia argillacea MUCL 33604]